MAYSAQIFSKGLELPHWLALDIVKVDALVLEKCLSSILDNLHYIILLLLPTWLVLKTNTKVFAMSYVIWQRINAKAYSRNWKESLKSIVVWLIRYVFESQSMPGESIRISVWLCNLVSMNEIHASLFQRAFQRHYSGPSLEQVQGVHWTRQFWDHTDRSNENGTLTK